MCTNGVRLRDWHLQSCQGKWKDLVCSASSERSLSLAHGILGLYNEMGEAIKRWIVEHHLRKLDFIGRVMKSHGIILVRNVTYAALYLRSSLRQSGGGQTPGRDGIRPL